MTGPRDLALVTEASRMLAEAASRARRLAEALARHDTEAALAVIREELAAGR